MDLEEIKYRMQNQKLYCCDDERLIEEQLKRLDMVHDYNNLKPSQQTEKKEMLKQFMTFQEAVKNKNSKVLASMIDLSVEDNIALVLDSDGNFPKGTDYGTLLTEKLISANIGRVTENLQSLTYINILLNLLLA